MPLYSNADTYPQTHYLVLTKGVKLADDDDDDDGSVCVFFLTLVGDDLIQSRNGTWIFQKCCMT